MTSRKYFAALLGFAFAAAWVGFGFGDAVLCLAGAGAFYLVGSFLEGDLDLVELQERFQQREGPQPATKQRSGARPRVQ
jgi:hypothetical protein